MANLQVKNVPDELYARIKARAEQEGSTLSEFVLTTLSKAVDKPSLKEWVAQARRELADVPPNEFATQDLLDEVRDEIEHGVSIEHLPPRSDTEEAAHGAA